MQKIFFTNTLTNRKAEFVPIDSKKITIYSCGPTVYDFAHIGNFRSFLMSDLLTRVLRLAGYSVTKVQNITDVGHLTNDDLADCGGEDKIAKKARVEKKDPFEIARNFETAFVEDETKLRIVPPEERPRATEFIREQLEITKTLIDRDFAYRVNGSAYFRVKKFEKYGQLSGNTLEHLQAGARIEPNSEKEDPMDFALWKKADTNHLMQWSYATGAQISAENIADFHAKAPLDAGFPGWHVECSAMSRAYLGDQFDIHTGGEDNVFPHHECEIAQNECSCSAENLGKNSVNYWLHAKHLLVDGEKMSKSKGNFYTVRDLFSQGWKGEEIRYLLLSAHYRTSLNFTFDGLEQARNSIARLAEARRIFAEISAEKSENISITEVKEFQTRYHAALCDDLNAAEALAVVFELVKFGLKARDEGTLSKKLATDLLAFLETDFDQIFDIFPAQVELNSAEISEIEAQIELRNQARADKNWAESDRIRDELKAKLNVELIDEAGKTGWKVVS